MKRFFILVIVCFLTGCSHGKNTFDCPPARGIGCESVSKVNDLINTEQLDSFIEAQNCKDCKKQNLPPSQPTIIHFEKYTDDAGVAHPQHDIILK